MIGWVRNIVIIFAILSVVYVLLNLTNKIRQKHKLNADYHAYKGKDTKAEYIDKGLEAYSRSIKPKMLLGVYLIPFIIIVTLISLAQYG